MHNELMMALIGLHFINSLVAVVLYAYDKIMARRGGRRISEACLHGIGLLGGWPGALLAQRWLRHKNRKAGFQLVFWLSVLLNLSGWAGYYWLAS